MSDQDHQSWIALQEYLPPKDCNGVLGYLRTLPVVRHFRWLVYFLQYYGWWLESDFVGKGHFHNYEDIRFLLDVWKGNR